MSHSILLAPIPWAFILTLVDAGRFNPGIVPPISKKPDFHLNCTELLEFYGYSSTVHEVVTEDGYILRPVRIRDVAGPSVLFIHGLALGTELWVLKGPGRDLALILSDLGYDVWLGTPRGVSGTSHVTLKKKQKEFWDFSIDEIGHYDLPAMIDVILSTTGNTNLSYVGTSLGGSHFTVLCNERTDYCSKFVSNVQFVPAMWMAPIHEYSPSTQIMLHILSAYLKIIKWTNSYSFSERSREFQDFLYTLCSNEALQYICSSVLYFITGFNVKNMELGWLSLTIAEATSGASTRQVEHLLQFTRKEGFRKFDFGIEKNLEIYGAVTPPDYNLTMITSPTAVYYSINDVLIIYPATMKILNLIGNLKVSEAVSDSSYGHAEFVFGKDLYKLVFPNVVNFLDCFSGFIPNCIT